MGIVLADKGWLWPRRAGVSEPRPLDPPTPGQMGTHVCLRASGDRELSTRRSLVIFQFEVLQEIVLISGSVAFMFELKGSLIILS